MSATNRFNELMGRHFAGCTLLMEMLDPHRGRAIRLYHIPGEWDIAGYSDGTDAFVIPTSTADPTSAKLKKILEDLRNGKQPEVTPAIRRRPVAATPAADAPAASIQRRPIASTAAPAGIQRRPIHS